MRNIIYIYVYVYVFTDSVAPSTPSTAALESIVIIRLEIKSLINYCTRSISLHYLLAHYIGFISNIQKGTMTVCLCVGLSVCLTD